MKEPEPPAGLKDAWNKASLFKQVLNMAAKEVKKPKCQEVIIDKEDIDLANIPIQTCWPGDVAPLITWGLVVTKGPQQKRQNLGIYRQQVIGKNRVIMNFQNYLEKSFS